MNELSREWLFWTAAAACAVGEAVIIASSLRFRRGSNRNNTVRETLWAVLPAIALAWLLVSTWSEVKRSSAHEQMTMPMPASNS